jgi:glycosyltransferase involved in cell wall biosynthesis
LTTEAGIVRRYVGRDVERYINGSFNLYIARIPSRSIVRDWSRRNIRYIRQLAQFILDNSFDVVHFNGFSGFQLYLYRYLRGIPKVYTIHDYLPHTGEWKLAPVILNRLYSKFDFQFIQHYDYLSKNFSDFYGVDSKKVHTVRCGPLEVYKRFSEKRATEEPNSILFFGRISPYKGIEYLIDAVGHMKRHVPTLKCVIAGRGDVPIELLNNGQYEIHNYHIQNDELVDFVQKASIVVLPYTDATHSAVLMTAYAFNKPVVASAVGGIPEVVKDGITGYLVPPRNSEALATAIVDLLRDERKRNSMKRNIKRMCREGDLSWTKIAANTLVVYRDAIRS